MNPDEIRISVRNLVEFVLQSGDLDNRRQSSGKEKDAMLEGTRIHKMIQNRHASEGGYRKYRSEVTLKREIPGEGFVLMLEGRADGLYYNESDELCVEEIKGVYLNLEKLNEPVPVHEAQAVCYAYMLAENEHLDRAHVVMTYCNIESEQILFFDHLYTYDELKEKFDCYVEAYSKWARYIIEHRRLRNESLKKLEFPFPYRQGQRDVVVNVYRSVTRGDTLFVQAPTGIGKTLSTVFPAFRAVGEGFADKIFYLTAKTITRSVASESFDILQNSGMRAGAVTLTAKEKICFQNTEDSETSGQPECNPDACPYAKGHFDRVNEAVYDLITHESNATREKIIAYAQKHQVCPFEMGLDVTLWMDLIICDYNYVFDPHAKLQRYFGENTSNGKQDFIFLVDEAHNLVERAREMYSAVLFKDDVLASKKHYEGISKKIADDAQRLNQSMLALKKSCDDEYVILSESEISRVAGNVSKMYNDIVAYQEDHPEFSDREGADFYFALRDFYQVYDNLGPNYRVYMQNDAEKGFFVKMYCIEPAELLGECLDRGAATVFFSATLLPMRYYKEVLRGDNSDYAIYVRSPFDQHKRLLCICDDVTSKYTMRVASEYEKIAEYLIRVVREQRGNYMVFFPSFAYMEKIVEIFDELMPEEIEIICQSQRMNEKEREEFLNEFAPGVFRDHSLLGMCVTGGIFGEGIDLAGDRLIGVMVVGTGLPMVCAERDILKNYFDEKNPGSGFSYAYLYPGMNRVLQAAGRLIRTDEDCGIIALMDYRFLKREYGELFPQEWDENSLVISSPEGMSRAINNFWKSL